MPVQQMTASRPARHGRADDGFARCIESCFDCAQACTACADARGLAAGAHRGSFAAAPTS